MTVLDRLLRMTLAACLVGGCLPGCGDETTAPADGPPAAPLSAEDETRLREAEQLLVAQLHEQVPPRLAPLLARDPVPVQAQYLAGQAAYYLGQYGEATERLADVLARAHDDYIGRSNALGFAHYKLGDFDASREVFAAIVEADPAAHKAHYGLGQVALTEGRYADAREHVERALQLASGYLKARFAMARVLDGLGESEAALAQTEELVQAWPSNEELLHLQAQLLRRLDREVEARAVEARRAQVYSIKEQVGDALGRIRAGEDNPLLRMRIVEGYLELGDVREALLQLGAGRTRWPDDPVLAQAEAQLQARLREQAEARADG